MAERVRAGRWCAVLETYALHTFRAAWHQQPKPAGQLQVGPHVSACHTRLRALLTELIAAGAAARRVRTDTEPAELASYCLHALGAAAAVESAAAGGRLATVTLAAR